VTPEFNERQLVLLGPAGLMVAGLALGAVAASFYFTVRATSGLLARRRAPILALRAASLGAALLLLFQPALELRKTTPLTQHVAVLVDRSESMRVAERGPGRERRIDRVAEALSRARPAWDRDRARVAHDVFTFGEHLEPATLESATRVDPPSASPQPASGARPAAPPLAAHSHLETALAELGERYRGGKLGAVLVLSDGAFDDGLAKVPLDAAAKDRLLRLGVPISTGFAGREDLVDLSIADLATDEFAFVHNALEVEVRLRATGLSERQVELSLVEETADGVRPVQARLVTVGGKGSVETRATFKFTPDRVGKFVYRVDVPAQPGEAVIENNRRRFVLRVVRDKIRVLQVVGRPSWDEGFLRKLLKRNPNVDLISFFILRTQSDLTMASPDELALIPFPTDELFEKELPSFDLIVMQNFNYAPYGITAYLPHIRRFVENGGGLAMLGGDLSFSSGGYAGTPVARVLPVDLLPNDLPPEQLMNEEDFQLRPTPHGLRHPIMSLAPSVGETEVRWSKLPPLDGANLVVRAKPGATVLGVHPHLRDQSGQPLPVLSAMAVGKGRSLALLSDGSWRWDFVAAGAGDASRAYDRFWENAIRWLIKDPALTLVRVAADRGEYAVGETVELGVRAFDADYRPAPGIPINVQVTQIGRDDPDPAAPPLALTGKTDEQGELRLRIPARIAGAFRAHVKGELPVADASLTESDDVYVVRSASRELDDPVAHPQTLVELAEKTGGKAFTLPSDLDQVPLRAARAVRIDRRKEVPLWDSAATLLVLLGCLVGEWVLRRRTGLP
jgi:uncharacterized membrane protein